MVKFSKQLELQLVPEWRGAYCQYKLLKKDLNKIKQNPRCIPEDPPVTTSASPINFNQNRRKSFWSHIDLIQVHNRKAGIGDDLIYETELFGPIAQSVYDQNFFTNLDTQLNKVNEFYKTKEQEFVQRGILLDKQICALTGVKKLLEQDRLKSLTVQVEDSTMRSGGALGDSLGNMESGYFEQEEGLLESIAKASQAATGLPSLPIRRRAGDLLEPSALGSSSTSFVSSDVTVGSLTRSSTNGSTNGNQVRFIIPRTTPVATIAALTQMLWEDVFRQSKRSATDYRGKEDITLSQKKVQSAALMLRAAFHEFYRGLGMLNSYSSLNMVAFAKIMKKYDKVTGLCVGEKYMHHVEQAYVNNSDKAIMLPPEEELGALVARDFFSKSPTLVSLSVVQLMEKVEDIFAEHFAGGNRRQAMATLRPMQQTASHNVTYFLGFFTGCSLALMAAFGFIIRVDGDNEDIQRITYLHSIFPTFSMLALVLLHMYLYGWNVYIWRRVRINYAFIFEFSPGSELRYREVLLLCTAMTTALIGAMVVHLSIHSTLINTRASAYLDLIPLGVLLVFLAVLFNPLNVCYRSSRFFFLSVMLHIICAPLYKVVLADFFLADQLTSQVAALRNFEFVLCYYLGGFFMTKNFNACTDSKRFKHWTYVIALLPYWWRFWQCMRRWIDESDRVHLANAGKYLSAMAAVALKITYSKNSGVGWLVMFFLASIIATGYQMYWDVCVDWGLLRRHAKNPWLRDQLLLDRKWIYFASMILNLVLRLAWLQSMTHLKFGTLDSSITDFLFASLEIMRRGHWNFYRLENEHLNNVGKYRAIKTVPLPFEDASTEI